MQASGRCAGCACAHATPCTSRCKGSRNKGSERCRGKAGHFSIHQCTPFVQLVRGRSVDALPVSGIHIWQLAQLGRMHCDVTCWQAPCWQNMAAPAPPAAPAASLQTLRVHNRSKMAEQDKSRTCLRELCPEGTSARFPPPAPRGDAVLKSEQRYKTTKETHLSASSVGHVSPSRASSSARQSARSRTVQIFRSQMTARIGPGLHLSASSVLAG